LGIIRIGKALRRPDWIEKADWKYLQASTGDSAHPLTKDAHALFEELAETVNI
jgi:hypothetical protein